MLESGTGMKQVVGAGYQRNQQLQMLRLRTVVLSVTRVSLALILVLLMVGFSLLFVDQDNVVHAAQANSLATRSAELASSGLASAAALGLTSALSSGLAGSASPLSTYGAGRGLTPVIKSLKIVIGKLVITKLDFEVELAYH